MACRIELAAVLSVLSGLLNVRLNDRMFVGFGLWNSGCDAYGCVIAREDLKKSTGKFGVAFEGLKIPSHVDC